MPFKWLHETSACKSWCHPSSVKKPLRCTFCWDGHSDAPSSVAMCMNFRQDFLAVESPGKGYRLFWRCFIWIVKLLSGNLAPADDAWGFFCPHPQLYPVHATQSPRKTLPSLTHITHTSCTYYIGMPLFKKIEVQFFFIGWLFFFG